MSNVRPILAADKDLRVINTQMGTEATILDDPEGYMKRRTRTDWIITDIQGMKAWILISIESRVQTEAGQRLREFCQVNTLLIANTLFQQHKRRLYTWTSPDLKWNQTDYIFLAGEDGEALFSQQKQDWELTVAQIMNSLLPDSDLNWRK